MRSANLRKIENTATPLILVAVSVLAYVVFPPARHLSFLGVATGLFVMGVVEFTPIELANRRLRFHITAQLPFLFLLGPFPVILMQSFIFALRQMISYVSARTLNFDLGRMLSSVAIPFLAFTWYEQWQKHLAERLHASAAIGMWTTIACFAVLNLASIWMLRSRHSVIQPVQPAVVWIFPTIAFDLAMAGFSTVQLQTTGALGDLLLSVRNMVFIIIVALLYAVYVQRLRLLRIPALLDFFTDAPGGSEMAEALFTGVAALLPVDTIELWRRRDRAQFDLAFSQDFALNSPVYAGDDKRFSVHPVRTGEGLVGFCASSREVVSVLSSQQPLVFDWESDRAKYPSAMAMPILAGDEVSGVLVVYHRRYPFVYRRRDRELMQALSTQVGLLYHSLLRLEETRAQMETDELTGLYNYRYFDTALHHCVQRSDELGQPISLLILDIDHFKQINDTYGHLAGNEVLRQLADVFRDMLRDDDIIARYGGEEFTVLLPGLDQHTAEVVAERIRKRIEERVFSVQSDLADVPSGAGRKDAVNQEIQLTVSIGISAYPTNADSALTLIRQADRAMYIGSKQSGRNRVTVYRSAE